MSLFNGLAAVTRSENFSLPTSNDVIKKAHVPCCLDLDHFQVKTRATLSSELDKEQLTSRSSYACIDKLLATILDRKYYTATLQLWSVGSIRSLQHLG